MCRPIPKRLVSLARTVPTVINWIVLSLVLTTMAAVRGAAADTCAGSVRKLDLLPCARAPGRPEPRPLRRPATARHWLVRPRPIRPHSLCRRTVASQSRRRSRRAEQQIQFDRNGLVTMHVNELDVRQLLELLSRRSGLNILVSPKVSGTITANFENTSVEKVLKAVIKLANLIEKTEGTIHFLYTKGEIDEDAETTRRNAS